MRCGQALFWAFYRDPKLRENIAASNKLGPYLKQCLPSMLMTYGDKLDPLEEGEDDD